MVSWEVWIHRRYVICRISPSGEHNRINESCWQGTGSKERFQRESCPWLNPQMKLTAHVLSLTAKLISGASVRWMDCDPENYQRVYFANHTSHLDALVLWASLPRHIRMLTRPVAARDYWEKTWLRRHIASQLNVVLIDRKDIKIHKSPVQIMINGMGDSHSLIVFPEGRRNTGEEMIEFKSGLFHLAKKRPDLELVPVFMDNLNRVLPRGEFLPVPLLSCITIGPPIWLEKDENKLDFLERARESVQRLKEI